MRADREADLRLAQMRATRREVEDTKRDIDETITFTDALTRSFEEMASPIRLADSLATSFTSNLSTGITDAILAADSFSDAVQGMTRSLAEAVAQALIFATISRGLGFGATALFGPAPVTTPVPTLQHGGRIGAHHPSIVGEAGPELFVPDVAGRVIPASDTSRMLGRAGDGVSVEVEVNITSAPSTPTVTQTGSRIDIAFDEAMAQNIGRAGTATSKALNQRFGLSPTTRR